MKIQWIKYNNKERANHRMATRARCRAAPAHTYATAVSCADSRLRGEFRRSRPLIYISPPIWVNNCPRSAPPSAAVHLATPNHCSPNVKRSSGSSTSAMVRSTDCGCCQSDILLLRTTLDTN